MRQWSKNITFIFDSTILEERISWGSNRPAKVHPRVSQTRWPRHRHHGTTNPHPPPHAHTGYHSQLRVWESRECALPVGRWISQNTKKKGLHRHAQPPSHQLSCSSVLGRSEQGNRTKPRWENRARKGQSPCPKMIKRNKVEGSRAGRTASIYSTFHCRGW